MLSPLYYSTVQAAYNDALEGDTIEMQAWHFNENLIFDRNITVNAVGGFDPAYTNNPQGSTINGTVTISNGTVEVDKLIIQ